MGWLFYVVFFFAPEKGSLLGEGGFGCNQRMRGGQLYSMRNEIPLPQISLWVAPFLKKTPETPGCFAEQEDAHARVINSRCRCLFYFNPSLQIICSKLPGKLAGIWEKSPFSLVFKWLGFLCNNFTYIFLINS